MTAVDVAPAIVAGKNNESTAKSPLTTNSPSVNCKNWLSALLPNKMLLAVIFPSGVKWNADELISMLPFEPLTNVVVSFPKKKRGASNIILLPLAFKVSVCISIPSSNIK